MNVTSSILPIAAVVSAALAGFSGKETITSYTTPPVIEGVGKYSQPVSAGDKVLVHWEIEKRTGCPGLTSRVWDGQNGFHLTEQVQQTVLPEGRADRFIETQIPSLAPEGELALRIVGFFQCDDGKKMPFTIGPVVLEVSE